MRARQNPTRRATRARTWRDASKNGASRCAKMRNACATAANPRNRTSDGVSHVRFRLTILLLSLGLALLGGCATPGPKDARRADGDILTADTILKPATPLPTDDGVSGIAISPEARSDRPSPKPEIEVGTAQFYKKQPGSSTGSSGEG